MLEKITYYANVYAATPKLDEEKAKEFVGGFINPAINIAVWIIPIAFALWTLVQGLIWYFRDEDERESKPFLKTFKKGAIVAVIIWSIDIIAAILGIGK